MLRSSLLQVFRHARFSTAVCGDGRGVHGTQGSVTEDPSNGDPGSQNSDHQNPGPVCDPWCL